MKFSRVALATLVLRRGRRIREVGDMGSDALVLLGLVSLGLLGALLSTGNRDIAHLDWSSPIIYPAFVAYAFGLRGGRNAGRTHDQSAAMLWRRICVSLLAAGLIVFGALTEAVARTPSSDSYFGSGALVRYISAHTSPGDTIAAFPFGGKEYMFGRPAALGYTLLWPGRGYYSTPQLRQAGEEMIRHRPKLVIFGTVARERGYQLTDWSSYFSALPRVMKFARTYRFTAYVHVHSRDEGKTVYRVYTRM